MFAIEDATRMLTSQGVPLSVHLRPRNASYANGRSDRTWTYGNIPIRVLFACSPFSPGNEAGKPVGGR